MASRTRIVLAFLAVVAASGCDDSSHKSSSTPANTAGTGGASHAAKKGSQGQPVETPERLAEGRGIAALKQIWQTCDDSVLCTRKDLIFETVHELKGITFQVTSVPVSKADSLNGVQARYQFVARCEASRKWQKQLDREGGQWSKWEDGDGRLQPAAGFYVAQLIDMGNDHWEVEIQSSLVPTAPEYKRARPLDCKERPADDDLAGLSEAAAEAIAKPSGQFKNLREPIALPVEPHDMAQT